MSVRITHQEIEHDDHGHTATVRVDGNDVVVVWNCGDEYHFTADDAREAVENVRLTAEDNPGVWFSAKDSSGVGFAVQIIDGDLYADRQPVDDPGALAHVPWADVRKAVSRALRQIERRDAVAA